MSRDIEQKTVAVEPKPRPVHYDFPEHWLEFLEYVEKHDPGLLPIIESEGPNIGIVKYPYLQWEEKFKR